MPGHPLDELVILDCDILHFGILLVQHDAHSNEAEYPDDDRYYLTLVAKHI